MKQVSIRLDDETYKRLKRECFEHNRTLTDVLKEAIESAVKRMEKSRRTKREDGYRDGEV